MVLREFYLRSNKYFWVENVGRVWINYTVPSLDDVIIKLNSRRID